MIPLPSGPDRSCLLLAMRHLGDSVILAGLVNSLRSQFPEMSVDILGRPGLQVILRSFSSFRDYIEIDLPLYGHHRRDGTALSAALHTMLSLRRRKASWCINTIGDVRENLIGRLVGSEASIAPVFEQGHLFKRKMTDKWASILPRYGIRIPSSFSSYYDSLDYFAL